MDYLEINRKLWDARTAIHVKSAFYRNQSFIDGRNSLNRIELDLLGNLTGKSILHLQCHFGQDSISLSRLGAEVTGVDFSPKSIALAKELAAKTGTETSFICADIYDLPALLHKSFDMVFTTYGTIGWLPDLNKWASVISRFLKPGGQLVFVEFHPVVWMFDDDLEKVVYSYHRSDPIVEMPENTYADESALVSLESVSWNHGLAEVFQALKSVGLNVDDFREYNYSPYNCFRDMVEFEPGKYRIRKFDDKIPLVYSMTAHK